MKIAMIGHKRIPSREGGIEIVVQELSTRLAAEGHTVHAYNRMGHHVSGKEFDQKETLQSSVGDIHIITIPTFQNGKLNALVYSILGTLRALVEHYDAIHYHAEGPCAMLWLPHLLGVHTVATIHGLDWQRAKWGGFATRYLKFGEKMAAKYADELVVLSRNVQQYFEQTYGRTATYIPNGVAKPRKREAGEMLNKWGLQKDGYLLFLARIVPEKGLHYLIDAYQGIGSDKKLVIAGGSSHTDDYLIEIKQKASEDGRIIFTGFVQGEELEELYSNAYLYVLPSDLEGMPLSLLEAMSYGNCCVTSDISECIEVVEDKAFTFQKGNVQSLRERLLYLLDHPEVVEQLREKASDFICKKYHWDTVVKETTRLYSGGKGTSIESSKIHDGGI